MSKHEQKYVSCNRWSVVVSLGLTFVFYTWEKLDLMTLKLLPDPPVLRERSVILSGLVHHQLSWLHGNWGTSILETLTSSSNFFLGLLECFRCYRQISSLTFQSWGPWRPWSFPQTLKAPWGPKTKGKLNNREWVGKTLTSQFKSPLKRRI